MIYKNDNILPNANGNVSVLLYSLKGKKSPLTKLKKYLMLKVLNQIKIDTVGFYSESCYFKAGHRSTSAFTDPVTFAPKIIICACIAAYTRLYILCVKQ